MQISFMSMAPSEIGNSSLTAAIASIISLQMDIKTLITHTHFTGNILEKYLTPILREEIDTYNEKGIDALIRLARNKKLTAEMINSYSTSLLKNNRLDLLNGTEITDIEIFNNNKEVFLNEVLFPLKKYYDILCIDLESKMDSLLTKNILSTSDVIIISISQSKYMLDKFFKDPQYEALRNNEKVIINISKYNKHSKLTSKNIRKAYGIKNLIVTPYNIELMDASNEGKILEFVARNLSCKPNSTNYEFIKELKKIGDRLLTQFEEKGVEMWTELSI